MAERFSSLAGLPHRHGDCYSAGVKHPLAILHANCQGEPLARALLASPEFRRSYVPRVFLNYAGKFRNPPWTPAGSPLPAPRPPVGGPRLDALLRACRRAAPACAPQHVLPGALAAVVRRARARLRDTYLDRLLTWTCPPRHPARVPRPRTGEALRPGRPPGRDRGHGTERQARTPVPYLDHVLEHFRKRPLFLTVNHPSPNSSSWRPRASCARWGGPGRGTRAVGLHTGYETSSCPSTRRRGPLRPGYGGARRATRCTGRALLHRVRCSYVACRQAAWTTSSAF
jgi:hypothetical protein